MILKLIAGQYKVPVDFEDTGDRYVVRFRYNKVLLDEIKSMEGAKWHGYDDPNKKYWSILKSQRNTFAIRYLAGEKVFDQWDKPLERHKMQRSAGREHQQEYVDFGITRRHCIIGGEMGTGKTLSAIEIMEQSGFGDWFWVAPKGPLRAAHEEFRKWDCKIKPQMYTYEELKKVLANWPRGYKPPRGVIFDESSKIKNPKAQRSMAALHLANAIRDEHGFDSYVIEMSGTPAPKDPTDWWHQCEVACPGYVKEGSPEKLKKRLALIAQEQSLAGATFPRLVTWWDDANKCLTCGQPKGDNVHALGCDVDYHDFRPSENEIFKFYQRLKGLVLIKFKKDCLELPDKQYMRIYLQPTPSTLRVAKVIANVAPRAVTAMALLRELSDGFQYREVPEGDQDCNECQATGMVKGHKDYGEDAEIACPTCGGSKRVPKYTREAEQVPTPKEQALKDILDDHDDIGRLVVYAGFTASVDRVKQLVQDYKWGVVRVDGRGWHGWDENGQPIIESNLLRIFQEDKEKYPKMCFVAQPSSGGMGITLTASPTIVFWSNDFNGESRTQAEDRIHRMGMDENKGATIIDLIHLPTDEKVVENLKTKRKLELMSMGDVQKALETTGGDGRVY